MKNKRICVTGLCLFIIGFSLSCCIIDKSNNVANAAAISLVDLTIEEIKLYASHPQKALTAKKCAEKAQSDAEAIWKPYTLWQGNGDAFRHAYWSALMTKKLARILHTKQDWLMKGLSRVIILISNQMI